MSTSYTSFSTPALRRLSHSNVTLTLAYQTVINPRVLPERRVVIAIQNKSTTANIEAVFNDTDTDGILIAPMETFTIDNFNGTVRLKSYANGSIAHIAIGSV